MEFRQADMQCHMQNFILKHLNKKSSSENLGKIEHTYKSKESSWNLKVRNQSKGFLKYLGKVCYFYS